MVGTKTPRTPAALDAAAAVVDRLEAGAGQMRDPCAVKPGLPPVVGSATDHGRGPRGLLWSPVVKQSGKIDPEQLASSLVDAVHEAEAAFAEGAAQAGERMRPALMVLVGANVWSLLRKAPSLQSLQQDAGPNAAGWSMDVLGTYIDGQLVLKMLSLQPNNWMLVVETGWRGSLYGGPGA
jgi:hypothetical protein